LRHYFPKVLSPEEALALAADVGYRDFSDSLISPLVDLVRSVAGISLAPPSYCRIEARPAGHPWHEDTGTAGHMGWCRWSASALLTPSAMFTGGGFYFTDDPETAIHHYCDLVVYDDAPSNRHCVTRSRGDRRSLIMFFTGNADG
jgi:hypothetical protein